MLSPNYFHERSTRDERGCWIWSLRLDVRGYGRMQFGHRPGYLAHRAAYEVIVGPIPEGMTLDHLCYQTACINPDHLRIATLQENAARQRRASKTHCVNGHEFTPENTYLRPERSQGRRSCRKCNAQAQSRRKARTRAA